MIENIKKFKPEDYLIENISKKESEIIDIGIVGIFFKYCYSRLKKLITKKTKKG